jgi:ketosteroid isomerase-like protein
MADHPMAAKYREGTKAMEEGRPEEAADMMADDIVWWQIGSAEPLRGKQALMESMGQMEDWDIKVDLHDVVANDEHIIALVNATATKDGKTLRYRTAEIHHHKDGKITERWAFSDDTDAINKFFA